MEKVVSFDLSGKCIGVAVSKINGDSSPEVQTFSIIPKTASLEPLGYNPTKGIVKTRTGNFRSYLKPGEKSVSKAEKRRRDVEVRDFLNESKIVQISKEIANILDTIEPTLVLAERNELFNGILTSALLSRIMGVLEGLAGSRGIPLKKYSVKKVRGVLDLPKMMTNLVEGLTELDLETIPNLTKRAINKYLAKIYGTDFATDDESDACAVFHYWYTNER